MLQKLAIQNYAIIDQLDIHFSPKLNVITGETGAGKSIIVGALGLILGERADSSVLTNQPSAAGSKERKCVVEGVFAVSHKKEIQQFLLDNDLDVGEELVIRREISSNGKSRAFVQDTPVTLVQLHSLSRLLVDLHQQFDTLEIGESDFQRQVTDALAGQSGLVDEYRSVYRQWQESKKAAGELIVQKARFDKETDYNRFQFTELDEANFRENELEEIEASLKMLNHAEGIKTALNQVYFALREGEQPLVQQLKSLQHQLNAVASYHPDLAQLVLRLQSAQVELQEVAADADRLSDHIQFDAEEAALLNERLSLGYKLQKKHGVGSTTELLAIREQLAGKLQAVLHIDEAIREKEKEAERYFTLARQTAATISAGRVAQVKPLQDKVNKLLAQVGMPNAKLKVDIIPGDLNPFGADTIDFLFDANKSGQFQPLRKVASGGELSRLMLCIKSLVAKSMDLPTLIFDEIDTGISGEAARQVGIIMKELSAKRQVICITHQPQIAGKGDTHFFVYKEMVKDTIKTNIRALTTDERITAIAKMLSGERPTAAALENAREMVMN